jgi:hypothetical protein
MNLLLCLGLASLVPACVAQSSSQKLPQVVTDMLNQQVWWDAAAPNKQNPEGLHFQFAKIEETNSSQGQYVRYRIYLPGAFEDEKYSLGVWKIGTKVTDLRIIANEVYVNAKGLLMTHRPRPDQETKDSVESSDEVEATLRPARGEPVRLVLSNPKKTLLFTGTVIPHPIESKDGNCRLEARLALEEGQAVLLYVDGLPPNTDVPFHSTSENESLVETFHVNAQGHAVTVDLPSVIGKEAGLLRVSLATKECSASLEIPWGKGSYKPL